MLKGAFVALRILLILFRSRVVSERFHLAFFSFLPKGRLDERMDFIAYSIISAGDFRTIITCQ
jgi:hypothetical protein